MMRQKLALIGDQQQRRWNSAPPSPDLILYHPGKPIKLLHACRIGSW